MRVKFVLVFYRWASGNNLDKNNSNSNYNNNDNIKGEINCTCDSNDN